MSEISSSEAVGFSRSAFRRWPDTVDSTTCALPLVMWAAVGLVAFYALTIAYGVISEYALTTDGARLSVKLLDDNWIRDGVQIEPVH